ncbi:hypothetical protein [Vreelandella populi]|uniref:Uncharacterized protein n=1 Tax=Vreelandella populi TaxID=2498858 RepID=A0A3S0Z0T7_9GAMM|nr:hypothetical protein [Halomonas populi]RUR48808.1 hypothetical protein ELY37_02860 [Halomonas populi]
MKIEEITVSMAQRGICVSASVSVPTRRQCTNERHTVGHCYPTKSTLKALWLFRRDVKALTQELQRLPGDHDLNPSNFRRGLFWT